MDSCVPKQFMLLAHKPILMHGINAFVEAFPKIFVVLVLPSDYIETWSYLCIKYHFTQQHIVVKGGENRFNSVKNALEMIRNDQLVAIHDGARPLVTPTLISRSFTSASFYGNAVPMLPVTESLRITGETWNRHVNRNCYCTIQTPQIFHGEILKKAYKADFEESFTDDATVIEKMGEIIHLVEGEKTNIKITYPFDINIAEVILKELDTRF